MIFDCHAHLICADQKAYPPRPLRGELTPGEFDSPMTVERLVGLMDQHGVTQACAVQRAHVYGYDNSYTLDSVARFPNRFRAVVVLDATAADTPAQLRTLKKTRDSAGVRFGSATFPHGTLDWLSSPAARDSWAAATEMGLPICIHVLHVQREQVVPELARMIADFPQATVVVDHVAGAHAAVVEQRWLASQGQEPGPAWIAPTRRLADFPGVIMKFSDINLEGAQDGAAFVAEAVALFGPERMIWGSDIGQSRGDYGHMVGMVKEAVAGLPAAVQTALLYDNAVRIYGAK